MLPLPLSLSRALSLTLSFTQKFCFVWTVLVTEQTLLRLSSRNISTRYPIGLTLDSKKRQTFSEGLSHPPTKQLFPYTYVCHVDLYSLFLCVSVKHETTTTQTVLWHASSSDESPGIPPDEIFSTSVKESTHTVWQIALIFWFLALRRPHLPSRVAVHLWVEWCH